MEAGSAMAREKCLRSHGRRGHLVVQIFVTLCSEDREAAQCRLGFSPCATPLRKLIGCRVRGRHWWEQLSLAHYCFDRFRSDSLQKAYLRAGGRDFERRKLSFDSAATSCDGIFMFSSVTCATMRTCVGVEKRRFGSWS